MSGQINLELELEKVYMVEEPIVKTPAPTASKSSDAHQTVEEATMQAGTSPSKAKKKEEGTRTAHLNSHTRNAAFKYCGNTVITSKYNVVTFFPKNLFEQFRRLANIYFLIISCFQLFTSLSPTSKYTTAGPLAAVIAFSMLRELYEDLKRHKADREINGRKILVLRPIVGHSPSPSWQHVQWKDVVVGDFVKVIEGNEFPADLVLFSTSEDKGLCYVDTCNLDGETNLKMKSSLGETWKLTSESELSGLEGFIQYEKENKSLYTFTGTLSLQNHEDNSTQTIPVGVDNVLLRGAVLRNTKFAHGLVIFTGKHSKLAMNSSAAPSKSSNVEAMVNKTLFMVLGLLVALCITCTLLMFAWVQQNKTGVWYMPFVATTTTADTIFGFITFLILFNNFVPISLYVTMEFVKVVQANMLANDLEMYHEDTDTPAMARTSNLNEELGQIEFIFSDKTGTLTRNEMEFRKCAIAGYTYGFGTTEIGLAAAQRMGTGFKDEEASKHADKLKAQPNPDPKISFDDQRLVERLKSGHETAGAIREFLTLLSVAHTVVPEGDENDRPSLVYQAESPDEQALVSAARCLGFFFCGKTANSVVVNVHGEGDMQYDILAINKFNSARKRMSVICRAPSGEVILYVKGADNVIFDRLKSGQTYVNELGKTLASFASEGLRTLVLAKRVLPPTLYDIWAEDFHKASTALVNRELELDRVAEEIEIELELVGATAIEDKLQVGVPDAIATLAKGGLKIWVLTGDKEETAINIGFACQLLTSEMQITIINADKESVVRSQFREALKKFEEFVGHETEHLALVIDGKALGIVEKNEELQDMFLTFGQMCKAVIACRVSPNQKAEVVRLVKDGIEPAPMTLAIGDGANDVSMIQAAHVGIGISGNEGMQAVRSSDYAIAQFRFLTRLLLIHGRYNYKRISIVILYSFYKNCALVTSLFFYCLHNAYSGATLYDSYVSLGFNVIWTAVPIVIYGFLEMDVSVNTVMRNPLLYKSGQRREDFNRKQMGRWMLNAIIHAVLVYFIPVGIFQAGVLTPNGKTGDGAWLVMGTTIANTLAIVVNARLGLETLFWTKYNALSIGISIGIFFAYVVVYSLLPPFQMFWVGEIMYIRADIWLSIFITVFLCCSVDITAKFFERMYFFTPSMILHEKEHFYKIDDDVGIEFTSFVR